ncbi:MAG: GPR endopeptidase [Clostridia bacterium]|nr:GPR endopeptidase [Clostridia bacterium]
MNEHFLRSDLAVECGCQSGERGVSLTRGEVEGFAVLRVQIKTPEAADATGRPMGHYVTVESGPIGALSEDELERVCRIVGVELRLMAERLCGRRISGELSVLVVGLGNRRSTVDAVGPEAVARLSVTRHLDRMDGALFSTVGLCRISALEPGIPAATGLETAETVKGVVAVTHPDLVVAVDALTARSVERLGTTVQLSDGGIRPASGVGRGHCALDRESLGVPVISLGVPTAVGSDTLIRDLLQRLNASDRAPDAALSGGRHLVTLGEIDLLAQSAGALLARAVERAFSIS